MYTAKEPLQLVQVWAKPMPAGRLALFVLNADAHHAHSYALRLDQLGMPSAVAVRDLWRRRERGGASKRLSGNVPRLSSELLLLSPLSEPAIEPAVKAIGRRAGPGGRPTGG